MLMMANRTFPTSRARALLCIAHDPEARLRDIAAGLLELVVDPPIAARNSSMGAGEVLTGQLHPLAGAHRVLP